MRVRDLHIAVSVFPALRDRHNVIKVPCLVRHNAVLAYTAQATISSKHYS